MDTFTSTVDGAAAYERWTAADYYDNRPSLSDLFDPEDFEWDEHDMLVPVQPQGDVPFSAIDDPWSVGVDWEKYPPPF